MRSRLTLVYFFSPFLFIHVDRSYFPLFFSFFPSSLFILSRSLLYYFCYGMWKIRIYNIKAIWKKIKKKQFHKNSGNHFPTITWAAGRMFPILIPLSAALDCSSFPSLTHLTSNRRASVIHYTSLFFLSLLYIHSYSHAQWDAVTLVIKCAENYK